MYHKYNSGISDGGAKKGDGGACAPLAPPLATPLIRSIYGMINMKRHLRE